MEVKLHRALRNGRSVHINDVGRGLACGCSCPNCGAQLVARHGQVRQWCFAHYRSDECDVVVASETALHLAAKEVLLEGGEFAVPEARVRVTMSDRWGFKHQLEDSSDAMQGQLFDVRSEVDFGDLRPDVVAVFQGHTLFIEIAVTHVVDHSKKGKLRQLGIPCVELDLRQVDRAIRTPELRDLVLLDKDCKRWVFNRWAKRRHQELTQALLEQVAIANAVEAHESVLNSLPAPMTSSPQVGVCEFCGTETGDWWYFDSKTHRCRCHPCYRAVNRPGSAGGLESCGGLEE